MGQFFYLGVSLALFRQAQQPLGSGFSHFANAHPPHSLQPSVSARLRWTAPQVLQSLTCIRYICLADSAHFTRKCFTNIEIFLETVYSNFMSQIAHPFVKWAGGKTQLLPEIRKHYPHRIKKYCEPFVGGGAVLFDVLQKCHPEEILINDVNAELINTYAQIKNNCDNLIQQLSELQQKYKNQTLEENKIFFYEKRLRYNKLKVDENDNKNLEKAALFIFLNKTCFNGLYRVNKKGEFNVPFNNARNPQICDEENLKSCSKLLKNVQMKVGDYSNCKDFIDSETFVYLDPPYRPLTESSSFTSYSENHFLDKGII